MYLIDKKDQISQAQKAGVSYRTVAIYKKNGVIKKRILFSICYLYKIIYVFLTIFLYLLKCPQSLIL